MQILVFNAGSTSLKYKLFEAQTFEVRQAGNFQHLKQGEHIQACRDTLRAIRYLTDIKIVGHRVVHGGPEFREPTLINDEVFKKISQHNYLAPLHNPYNLAVIQATRIYLSNIPHLAVFDTGFFVNLPLRAKIYSLPIKYYEEHGIQRYGFHGISHQYVANEAAKILKKDVKKINLITCHLGGGCSIAAIKKGQPIDTSMGFTPLEGLTMMSRSGDIDPGLIFYLNEALHLSYQEIYDLLHHESGMTGLYGTSNFLKLLCAVKRGNKKAQLAFEIFIYKIQKYISAYWGILGDVQAIIFTGAIGAGDPMTRKKIIEPLKFLRKTKILAIPTDEELAIAQECLKFIF